MSSSDPLGVLRSHIEAANVAVPDEGTLQALLEVSGGDPLRAARLIIDDHRASQPRGRTSNTAFDESPSALRRRRPGYERMSFAENQAEYEAAVGTSRRRGAAAPVGDPPGTFAADGIVGIIYQALSLPFSLLRSLVVGISRVLRFPLVLAGWFSGNQSATMTFEDEDGPNAAEAFVNMLKSLRYSSESVEERFPTLLQVSYNDAIKLTKAELKMLVVVLISGNEKQDEIFLRILHMREVAEALSAPDCLLWGASIKRKEGYAVSRQLAARRFPYLGCIAMQATVRHGLAASSAMGSSPRLSLISRVCGAAATSDPNTIKAHLAASWERCSPFLQGLGAERIARETERRLMAEQDRAFEEVSRRDAERVAAKRREEERLRELEQEKLAQQQQRLAENDRKWAWLKWAKVALVRGDDAAEKTPQTTLNAVLPTGQRISKSFGTNEPLEHVFAWIETSGVVLDDGDDDTQSEVTSDPPSGYTHTYGFCVFHGYPRQKLSHGEEYPSDAKIADVSGLSPRANLIVEGVLACNSVGGDGGADGESESGSSGYGSQGD